VRLKRTLLTFALALWLLALGMWALGTLPDCCPWTLDLRGLCAPGAELCITR
jgi:hypothetical protein